MSRRNSQSSSQLVPRGGTPINGINIYIYILYANLYIAELIYVCRRERERERDGTTARATAISYGLTQLAPRGGARVSLHKILLCTMLYGVWHHNWGQEGSRILRTGIAIVLQP